jgi:hypothetical protein
MDKCFNCKHAVITGGDNVPYGSGYARLPEYLEECNSSEITDSEYEQFIEQDHSNCPYFVPKEYYSNLHICK